MTATTAEYTQKGIARRLDVLAAQVDYAGGTPASGRQCWFLAKLILENESERHITEMLYLDDIRLTKREASSLIDTYLNHC